MHVGICLQLVHGQTISADHVFELRDEKDNP